MRRRTLRQALPNPRRICGARITIRWRRRSSFNSGFAERPDWERFGHYNGLRRRPPTSAACGSPPRRAYRPYRSCGRVAEGGGLLNRYRVVKPYRGFESLRLRQMGVSARTPATSGVFETRVAPESGESAESRESTAVLNVVPLTHAHLASAVSTQVIFSIIANRRFGRGARCKNRCSGGPAFGHGDRRRCGGKDAAPTGRRSLSLFRALSDSSPEKTGCKARLSDSR